MQHIGLRTRLSPGCEDAYIQAHDDMWSDVVKNLERVGIHRYLISRDGLDLFHCVQRDDRDAALEALHQDPVHQRWQATMSELREVSVDMSGAGGRVDLIFRLEF